ncbi:dolichol-P-glucose transferase [Halomarina halobia]|uniref:Dolichol-P-glucose transferase n=1 Tax=Halomarina halobia TaxID=3033386 RepID=A0ABD6AD06_9EURY|nr:dolichol-P-glucose transferase [Halomarina sp. PSR21]
MSSVGLVVPAYRPDIGRLADYVRTLDERLSPAAVRVEIDAPEPVALDRLADLPATVNAAPSRRGKGAAVAAGFQALAGDDGIEVLAFADGDASTPVGSVDAVLGAVGRADLAVGSRRHPDAVVDGHQTRVRRRLGDGFAWLARRCLDASLFDYQCGTKALTAEAWRAIEPHVAAPGFAWDVEVIAVADALGHRVEEVPIRWRDRPGSTVAPVRGSASMARGLLSARWRARRVRAARAGRRPARELPAPADRVR